MPGPPPPPPAAPPPMMPPPPVFAPSKGGADDRGALLSSIRQGAKLKKTVTIDKSAPMISGKVASANSNNSISNKNSSAGNNATPAPMTNGMGLGGLFAGGMPKLRPTGRQLDGVESNTSDSNTSMNSTNGRNQRTWKPQNPPDAQPQPQNNFNNIQNQLKRQLASENSRNRGPPPPAPTRNFSDETSSSRLHQYEMKNGSHTVHQQSQSSLNLSTLHSNSSSLHGNVSTLHRKAASNVNISTLDSPFPTNNKPAISHGKPNLAPKPPSNGKPAAPPKKLLINGKAVGRAQSMKSPRSPSPQSPDNNNLSPGAKFGTVRNLTNVIGNSLAASTGNLTRQRPVLNMRPNGPPPSIPQQPPPPSKVAMKPPNHAPPPPPGQLPQVPSQAPPPPPPHKTQAPQVPSRAPPAIPTNNGCAPPPPPRHSSIRGDGSNNAPPSTTRRTSSPTDLDIRFSECFHTVVEFPRPAPFRRVFKVYSSKSVGNKQQAPQPPNQLQTRTWDTPAC